MHVLALSVAWQYGSYIFMSRPKCYVMSPLGFTEITREPYERILENISPVVEPINPFAIAGEQFIPEILEASGPRKQALWCAMAVKLYRTIREDADLGLAILNGEPPDFGVACEIGYGYALHEAGIKPFPLVAYRQDHRRSGETDNNLNAMALPPYMETGGCFVNSLDELRPALEGVVSGLREG